MTRTARCLLAVALAGFWLAACRPESEVATPAPRELDREANGHYCGMIVADHPGPKGQIFVGESEVPIWFSSVRDTVAFLMLPGEQKDIRAIYVNDMARARNWDSPEPGTWVEARNAWFVLGSAKRGGMGLAEAVPFGSEEDARQFAALHGGRLARLDEIPVDYIFDDGSAEASDHHSVPDDG